MIQVINLPANLRTVIGSEKREFAVKALHANPVKMSLFMLFFGIAWLLFSSIFVFVFLGPLFIGKEVHFTADDVPQVAGPGNLGPIIAPALIIGLFVVVGIGLVATGIRLLVKKGGYFVGTPTRLICYQGGAVRSIDWEQFSGDIEVKGDERKGDITLQMRSGKMVSSKNESDHYVPDTVYLSGIPDVFQVESICRERIKENDPTPVISASDSNPVQFLSEPEANPTPEESRGESDLNVF
jgi:hypothetical protein